MKRLLDVAAHSSRLQSQREVVSTIPASGSPLWGAARDQREEASLLDVTGRLHLHVAKEGRKREFSNLGNWVLLREPPQGMGTLIPNCW